MELTKAFWDNHQGFVLVASDGALRFTRAGRARYTPLFAKYGFVLAKVRDAERFRAVIYQICLEKLKANTLQLGSLLDDPATPEDLRELIMRSLAAELRASAPVFQSSAPTIEE
jgi:hypothetical protein